VIKPCQERRVQGGRNRKPRHWPGQLVAVAGFHEDSTFDDRLGQLFDEQRYAIGTLDDLVGNLLGQRLAAGQVRDYLDALPRRQGD